MRFPVKSFGGERLRRAFFGPFGLIGDRRHAVADGDGPRAAGAPHAGPAGLPRPGRRRRGRRGGRGGDPRRPAPALGRSRPWPASSTDGPRARRARGRTARWRPLRRRPGPPGERRLAGRGRPRGSTRRSTVGASAPTSSWRSRAARPSPRTAGSGAAWRVGDGRPCSRSSPRPSAASSPPSTPTPWSATRACCAALARERENLFGVYAQVAAPGVGRPSGDPVRLLPG